MANLYGLVYVGGLTADLSVGDVVVLDDDDPHQARRLCASWEFLDGRVFSEAADDVTYQVPDAGAAHVDWALGQVAAADHTLRHVHRVQAEVTDVSFHWAEGDPRERGHLGGRARNARRAYTAPCGAARGRRLSARPCAARSALMCTGAGSTS